MHIIWQFICVFLWLFVMPYLIGRLFSYRRYVFPKSYLAGLVCMFALFEAIGVPAVYQGWTVSRLTAVWGTACILLALIALCRDCCRSMRFVNSEWIRPMRRIRSAFWELQSCKRFDQIPGLLAIEIILFQVAFVLFHMHIDDDDSWYVGNAVVSYFTDTIYRIDPATGLEVSGPIKMYALAPYPILWAVVGRLTGVHPAILMHTILPLFLIPAAYMVSFLIADVLFDGNKDDIWYFMLFLSVFHMFANFSVRSSSTFLLFRIWQGKAMLCCVFLPMVLYAYMRCVRDGRGRDWLLLMLTAVAGMLSSTMGIILAPALLASLVIVTLFTKRDFKVALCTGLCIVPCLFELYLYFH